MIDQVTGAGTCIGECFYDFIAVSGYLEQPNMQIKAVQVVLIYSTRCGQSKCVTITALKPLHLQVLASIRTNCLEPVSACFCEVKDSTTSLFLLPALPSSPRALCRSSLEGKLDATLMRHLPSKKSCFWGWLSSMHLAGHDSSARYHGQDRPRYLKNSFGQLSPLAVGEERRRSRR